jgi:hypothetical protein
MGYPLSRGLPTAATVSPTGSGNNSEAYQLDAVSLRIIGT